MMHMCFGGHAFFAMQESQCVNFRLAASADLLHGDGIPKVLKGIRGTKILRDVDHYDLHSRTGFLHDMQVHFRFVEKHFLEGIVAM
jgi:hypothetical protein